MRWLCLELSFRLGLLERFGILNIMTTITMDEIQRDLPGYLKRVRAGETLLILQDDKPVAELKPVAAVSEPLRPFGLCAGEFTVPDDFDSPLPADSAACVDAVEQALADIDVGRNLMPFEEVCRQWEGEKTEATGRERFWPLR